MTTWFVQCRTYFSASATLFIQSNQWLKYQIKEAQRLYKYGSICDKSGGFHPKW